MTYGHSSSVMSGCVGAIPHMGTCKAASTTTLLNAKVTMTCCHGNLCNNDTDTSGRPEIYNEVYALYGYYKDDLDNIKLYVMDILTGRRHKYMELLSLKRSCHPRRKINIQFLKPEFLSVLAPHSLCITLSFGVGNQITKWKNRDITILYHPRECRPCSV